MPRSLAEKITFVLDELGQLGIATRGASRLEHAAAVFIDEHGLFTTAVGVSDPDFEYALEALRDFTVFEFVLDPWEFGTNATALEKLAVAAVQDDVSSFAGAQENTPGRDTLVELLLATAFVRAGCGAQLLAHTPDHPTPDIRTRANGRFYFLEAKRAKSRWTIMKRIKRGVQQINEMGCPGAVYVDVTMAFNPRNERVRPLPSMAVADAAHAAALQAGFEPLRRRVDEIVANSRVTSLYFEDHQIMPIAGVLQLHTTRMVYPAAVELSHAKSARSADAQIRRAFRQAWNRY